MPKRDVNQALKCENGGPTGGRGLVGSKVGGRVGVVNAKRRIRLGVVKFEEKKSGGGVQSGGRESG